MAWWKFWKRSPDSILAGTKVDGGWVKGLVKAAIPAVIATTPRNLDRIYLVQRENTTKALVNEAWDPSTLCYHSNSKEFPDCDDFALACNAMVRIRAANDGMQYGPAFGLISLTKIGGGPHLMNIAIFEDGQVALFEPQTDKWEHNLAVIEKVRWIMF